MKCKRKILPVACCVAIMSACASNQKAVEAPLWMISPTMKTSNSSANPDAMYKLGRYYQGQQRDELAIDAYQKSIKADSGFVESYNGLGVIYARQGKYQLAIEAFKAGLQQAPTAAHLYSNMGYAYYLQGQYTEAVTVLKQATALDPLNQRALNNLGMAYAKSGSHGESTQAFTQAANALPVAVSSSQGDSAAISEQSYTAKAVEKQFVEKPSNVQELALPKSVGIIRPAPLSNSVPVVDSHVKLVQLAPNVYELHTQLVDDTSAQLAQVAEEINTKPLRVEVSNGNGVTGMAAKVGVFLADQGYPSARLTNQKPFTVRRSQIQYRDGHYAEAQLLQDSLPEAPALIQRNDMRADIGVRLVLGKDMSTHLAYFGAKPEKTQLALMVDESKKSIEY